MTPRPSDEEDSDTFGAFDPYEQANAGKSEPPFMRPKRYPIPTSPLHIGVRSTLLGLEWREPYWVGEPLRLFRPEGLLVANVPPGARLSEWNVGAEMVLPFGRHPIALSTFTLLEELDSQTPRRSPARPHFPACDPTMLIRLKLIDASGAPLGPPLEPTVWGFVPRYV